MPSAARIVVPGFPHHVVHRGHDRQPIFRRSGDYERYLATLAEFKDRYRVKVYAYCLMTNHVHLLLEPADGHGMARLMRRAAGRHTRRLNAREGRRGTLWEGRYGSSVVDRDAYLLNCVRYIELNPVRAGLVRDPAGYAWSSCRVRLGLARVAWLDPYPGEEHFAGTEYHTFLLEGLPLGDAQLIRQAVRRGHLTGDRAFAERVQHLTGRRIAARGPGRPRKQSSPENKSV